MDTGQPRNDGCDVRGHGDNRQPLDDCPDDRIRRQDDRIRRQAATAVVDLAIGVAIGTLLAALSARAARAVRGVRGVRGVRREAPPPRSQPYDYDQYEHPPTQPIDYRS